MSGSSRPAGLQGQQQWKQVGKYAYRPDVDRIGRGSFATVYKARRLKDGGRVAIKRVNITRLKRRLKENLELEISIMKRMRHPNIAKLYDTLESAEHMYLVMEFCDGGDLAKYIAKNKPLEEALVKRFAQQIASALLHLGQHNIIHRDIKPQNVLLHRGDNGDLVCKVADFGFARYLESELAATLCGSPLYMAPEILDSQPYGRKADLWSVGAVLYECLAGRAPFKANNYIELSNVIKSTCQALPMPPGISEPLEDLLRRVLKRDPEERIAVDDFFLHPWIDLDSYQRTIVIGPDDEPDGEANVELAFQELNSPEAVAVLPLSVTPTPHTESSPREETLTVAVPAARQRRGSESSLQSEATPPSVSQAMPRAMAMAATGKSLLGASPPAFHIPFAPPTPPPTLGHQDSSRQLAHRPSAPTFVTQSPPTPHYLQLSSGSGRHQSIPTVNPFKLPRRASTTALSQLGAESGQSGRSDDGGDSYVIVDKDFVEVNAFADALDLNKRTPSSASIQRLSLAVPRSFPGTADTSAGTSSPMTSLANALNAATTYTTQKLFNVASPASGTAEGGSSFNESAVLQDIEDYIRQAQSIAWLASRYDDGRQGRSTYMSTSTSSTYSSSPSQTSQAQACALALYVRALKQYRRGMDAVKTTLPTHASISPAINTAVQRLRDKYNECLELAETVKSRMLAVSSHQDFRSSPRPQADRLLFEAAMRLCREAAACELLSDQTHAERQYKHAFNLLAALHTNDADPSDKAVIEQYMRNVYKRLAAIRGRRSSTSS